MNTYLLNIARALRDEVAPHVEPGAGRLALLACIRMLLRLARPQIENAEAPPLDALPTELRDAIRNTGARPLLPHETPTENSALASGNAAAIDQAVAWINHAKQSDRTTIAALADWEGRLQDAAEAQYETLQTPVSKPQDKTHVLDPHAVEAYFKSRFGDQARMTAFKQLVGGTSKQTALVSLSGTDAVPNELVIRRDQTAETMTGSVVNEFPLLQIVHEAGVAVPRPLFLEKSPAALGKPFVALERLFGTSSASHFQVPEHTEVAYGLAEQIARLHAIPAQKFSGVFGDYPLQDSPERRREPLAKMIEGWHHFVRTPSITMTAAFRWMQDNLDCAAGPMTLVHGDLGFHNMLVDGERFVSLLDWETAHIDHPAGDLGYVRPVIERLVPWEKFLAVYRAAGGQPVTNRQIAFFGIWEILRINIQLRHVRMLVETGATEDIRLCEVGTYYVPRFVHRISQHLRRALHES